MSGLTGVIGGSGLYQIDALTDVTWRRIESPFGAASDEICFGTLEGARFAFLPRHGRGHHLPPSAVNYRANIDVLKRVGVDQIISLSAVGSLRETLPPGSFVIVDQFIDRTFQRQKSFFGEGLVAHVSMADPVCGSLGDILETAASSLDLKVRRHGTYLVMEGPHFSSRAESHLYRSWGCDVIGMTNMPEAKLAREAEICYASVGMVTDFDCWHPEEDAVSVEAVVRVLIDNADKGRALLRAAAADLGARPRPCKRGCHHALEHAIITTPAARDPDLAARLDAVAGRILNRGT